MQFAGLLKHVAIALFAYMLCTMLCMMFLMELWCAKFVLVP